MDLLVEDSVIVELKSVEAVAPVHEATVLTYLRLSRHHLGLLINFNLASLKDGIRRYIVGKLETGASNAEFTEVGAPRTQRNA